jgi:hypothetical protein
MDRNTETACTRREFIAATAIPAACLLTQGMVRGRGPEVEPAGLGQEGP